MKLTTRINGNDIECYNDIKPGEYLFLNDSDNKLCGIVFKCPGCNEALAISNHGSPHWVIDFKALTATPSILHSRAGKGCGWHGHLTNGELK